MSRWPNANTGRRNIEGRFHLTDHGSVYDPDTKSEMQLGGLSLLNRIDQFCLSRLTEPSATYSFFQRFLNQILVSHLLKILSSLACHFVLFHKSIPQCPILFLSTSECLLGLTSASSAPARCSNKPVRLRTTCTCTKTSS